MTKLAYTIGEAATEASVEQGTIVRAIQDGQLRARSVDGDLRVLHADISRWLEGCDVWATRLA